MLSGYQVGVLIGIGIIIIFLLLILLNEPGEVDLLFNPQILR